jgi:hypothetical protein
VNHLVDDKLKSEIRHFRLAYGCDRCGHFDPDEGRCALGIPREGHPPTDLRERLEMSFCKSFELW